MLLIREVFHCKPGKVRPMVERFQKMSKLGEKSGMPKMRVMTDLAGPKYWTLVAEMEVANLKAFEDMFSGASGGMSEEDNKEMEQLMTGYHDMIVDGHREIYKIEEVKAGASGARPERETASAGKG